MNAHFIPDANPSRIRVIASQFSVLNKTNSKNGHLVFSIFKKKQENNGFLNIENTRCPFSEVLFCIFESCRLAVVSVC